MDVGPAFVGGTTELGDGRVVCVGVVVVDGCVVGGGVSVTTGATVMVETAKMVSA